MPKRIIFFVLFAIGGISFGSILVRLTPAPPFASGFWRLVFAGLVLWPFALVQWQSFRNLSRRDLTLVLLAGLGLAVHFLTWMTSLFLTTVSSSTVLVNTQVLFVALGEWLFLKQRYSPLFFLSLFLALGGVFLMGGADLSFSSSTALRGDLLALAGGLAAAVYFYLGGILRDRIPLAIYGALVYSFGALFMGIALLIQQGLPGFFDYPPITWLWFVLLALVPQIIGHTLLNYLLAQVQPVFITLAVLGEPMGATLWAFLLFAEKPPGLALVGGFLILVALVIVPKRGLLKVKIEPSVVR
jgi:drug/metabolite transporter (DMT)-like permease